MSRAAQEYVLSLDGSRVNRHQHHLLLVLAFYHQASRETYWPSHKTLAEKCHVNDGLGTKSDQRQVRRMVQELENLGILRFTAGIGRGNQGAYVFVELENRTGQSSFDEIKQDTKEDNPRPVRSIEVNLTRPIQDQNLTDDAESNSTSSEFDLVNRTPQSSFVERVIRAFEQSPVTSGKAKRSDVDAARALLQAFSPEQIEYGILLASARRLSSGLNELAADKVHTLAYFRGAIEEGLADEPHAATYVEYLRRVVRRYPKKQPQSEIA